MNAVFHCRNSQHQKEAFSVLEKGLAGHNILWKFDRTPVKTADIVFVWSWNHGLMLDEYKAAGVPIVYVERPFLHPKEGHSLSLNGFNGFGEYMPPQGERTWGPPPKPWKYQSGPVLIVGQHPYDDMLVGESVFQWEKMVANRFPNYIYRKHPLNRKSVFKGLYPTEKSLEHCLEECSLCVTYTSNAAVEAVMAGVPTISISPLSMAYDVTGHEYDEVVRPDRTEWWEALKWKQWTAEELSNPDCVYWEWLLSRVSAKSGGV